jgi:hypothetical protein
MIHPEVLARWAAFSEPLEGRIPWLYLDVKGLPTVGVGCLLDNPTASQAIPWSSADGGPATALDIVKDWRRVLAIGQTVGSAPRHTASHYRAPDGLHLSDVVIDAMMHRRLQANARTLALRFPAFPSWPWQAQMGALSMAWAMGAGFPAKYPKWAWAAHRAHEIPAEWATCARECFMHGDGLDRRNDANRRLFEEATTELPTKCKTCLAFYGADYQGGCMCGAVRIT